MKKLLLLLAVVSVVFFVSCKKEFWETCWRTTHQYFSLTVGENAPEGIKEMREQETSVAVSEAESYKLTFKNDGTGLGSGVRHDGDGRYNFGFIWQSSDGKLSITETKSGYGGVFFTYDWTAWENVVWEIVESTVDKMILLLRDWFLVDGDLGPWSETHTYRYTFEKVK